MGQWIILKNIEDFKRKLAEEAMRETMAQNAKP